MIPQRNTASEYAKSYLYQEYNDIAFFIEDTCPISKKIVLEIIQRVFGNSIRINNIFSLGGKEKVLEKYYKRDLNKKQIYIIDGDLDLFYNEENEELKSGLLVLNRYCIENYLLDTNAIETILYEECHNETDVEKVCKLFQLNNWIKRLEKSLLELFILYAIIKKYNLSIETINFSVFRLINHSKNKYEIDKKLVKTRENELEKLILKSLTIDELEKIRVSFRKKLEQESDIAKKYLSAKDYVFPQLLLKIRHFSESKSLDKVLKYRLASKCNINELKELFINQCKLICNE